MSLNEPLDADLEAQAQELAARIRVRADNDILALARLLVSKSDTEVFGDTEFEARTIVHHLGALALQERLKKSLATKDRASTVPAVNSPPSSRRYRPKTPLSLLGLVPCTAGLLLLRPLRAWSGPLGSDGWPDRTLVHPGRRATGLPGWHLERRL